MDIMIVIRNRAALNLTPRKERIIASEERIVTSACRDSNHSFGINIGMGCSVPCFVG